MGLLNILHLHSQLILIYIHLNKELLNKKIQTFMIIQIYIQNFKS